ncbi:MAG: hypothetical protein WCD11_38045 [Solirubrobacteraceae bacterium]
MTGGTGVRAGIVWVGGAATEFVLGLPLAPLVAANTTTRTAIADAKVAAARRHLAEPDRWVIILSSYERQAVAGRTRRSLLTSTGTISENLI